MKSATFRAVAVTVVLVAVGACKSGPPAVKDVKMGKDKDATTATTTFDAKDTLYAVANIDNPPDNGKVVAGLSVVDVPGQDKGPIAPLQTTLNLTGGMNKVNLNFTPPPAGWPNGKYQLVVTLQDSTGAQKDQKTVDFSTSGNAPAAPPASDTAAAATTDSTATTSTSETTATTGSQQ